MAGELRKKTKSALIWNGINQFGRFGFRFIVTIVLARLLTPEDFGLIAMILVITGFSDLFIESGFRVGIIQKKKLNDVELSSVFYLNILIGLFFTVLVFFIAPWIAEIYENPKIVSLTQVLSLVYFFKSFSIVQHGLVSREMDFKKLTISMVGAQVFAGSLAIVAAFLGWGVWSLVLNLVLEAFLISGLFWMQANWKPKWVFKLSALKNLWGFSSKVLLVSFLGTLGGKVDLFFVGKFFSSATAGLYSKSKDFARLPGIIGTQIITTSLFPVFSKIQDNQNLFYETYARVYKLLSLVFVPLFALMFLGAHEIVLLLLGEAWAGAIVYFKWATIMGLYLVLNKFTNDVINAKGRSDLNLKRTLIQTPLRLGVFIAIPFVLDTFSPLYFIFVYIVFAISGDCFNKYFIAQISGVSFFRILKSGMEYIGIALLIIGGMQFLIDFLDVKNMFLELLVKSAFFSVVYFLVLALIRNKMFFWGLEKIKLIVHQRFIRK